jgi:hypothetical protein
MLESYNDNPKYSIHDLKKLDAANKHFSLAMTDVTNHELTSILKRLNLSVNVLLPLP